MRGAALALAGAALGIVVLAGDGAAHARLIRSAPPDGSSLTSAPRQLTFCFSELLEREFHSIELDAPPDPSGRPPRRAVQLASAVDPQDGTCLTARVPSLEPGSYVVRWRVVSRDGHTTRGLLRFRVD